MRKLEDVDLQPEERQKIRSQNGAWYITCDKKRIYYAGTSDFPNSFLIFSISLD